ncbi:hypothetical protein [Pseudomonas sp.]|uniref:hypothetical protein n=1 Tax=Pseudomonas sp. TaxID=306 RepID=UPI0028ABCF4F|nr:hypothetical protein [Pseudomonas sp.]
METYELQVNGLRYEPKGVVGAGATSVHVGAEQKPLDIHIITDTDWWAMAPGLIVALLVAWFTVGVQRNQIQANISNFRHQWMAELRSATAEQIMLLRIVSNLVVKNEGFKSSDRYYELSERLLQCTSRVELLLSRDGERPDDIRDKSMAIARLALRLDYKDQSIMICC